MSADGSVFVAACPLVGAKRVAVAHKESLLLTTDGAATLTIPLGHSVRTLGFVPVAESAAQQTDKKADIAVTSTAASSSSASVAPSSSAYIVTGGDDKVLTLLHVNSAAGTVTVVDTHGPVGKKVSHLLVVPTAGAAAADAALFKSLVPQPPTGIPVYCPNPKGTFATREAPSVALVTDEKKKDDNAAEDDEDLDENNVKLSGLSATDGHAVAAGRYYPNQIANVIFGNKFGEVYAIALLQTPTGVVFGPAPVFLLQHFSVLSALALVGYGRPTTDGTASDHCRIITCDRDAHTRVSKYPAAYEVEQFLWAPYVAPAEGEERAKQQDPIAAVIGSADGETIFTGDVSGRVSQYVATTKPRAAPATAASSGVAVGSIGSLQKVWAARDYFDFEDAPETGAAPEPAPANYGGVVGLALLADGTLLIARDHVNALTAVRGTNGTAAESEAVTAAVPLPAGAAPIVALVAAPDASAAVALCRDGALFTVSADLAFTPLLAAGASPLLAAGSLATVDLYYAWRSVFAENKQRRDVERNAADERNKTNPKTNENRSKKGGKAE